MGFEISKAGDAAMNWPMISLDDVIAKRSGTADPSKFPDEVFDLYSIPARVSADLNIRRRVEIEIDAVLSAATVRAGKILENEGE